MGYSPYLTSEAMQQTENNSYVDNEVARFADAVAAVQKQSGATSVGTAFGSIVRTKSMR